MTKIAIIFYSATGNVYHLAEAMAEGAEGAGAEVRLRHVAELAPRSAIDANPDWRAYVDTVRDKMIEATPDDLDWADGFAFGTPTRFGNASAQLKQYIDTLGGLWFAGKLADKAATVFTSAYNSHGGAESTIISLFNVLSHFGSVIVPPGFTDPSVALAGGNPYGVSGISTNGARSVSEAELAAARYQGARLTKMASKIAAN